MNIASSNFDLHATLKNRKSFIRSMESSYSVTKPRPINTEVILHDTSRVTVPVFNAKHMILDLLTDKNLLNKSNFAEGYDIFSDDVMNQTKSTVRFIPAMSGCLHVIVSVLHQISLTMTCPLH